MTIREQTETIERLTLSPYAMLSQDSRGRLRPEETDEVRPCFQRDRDRILHSNTELWNCLMCHHLTVA